MAVGCPPRPRAGGSHGRQGSAGLMGMDGTLPSCVRVPLLAAEVAALFAWSQELRCRTSAREAALRREPSPGCDSA